MKVILTDHIEQLGERGDSVTVKPGFARNYLIPKGLAYLDTPGNRKLFEQQQSGWEEMDLARRSAAEKMAAEMKGTELRFERRAGEKDVLFGSVTVVDIARELADRGFDLERRRIQLDQPIKALGTFDVEVVIHHGIVVTVPVHVVRPGDHDESVAEAVTAAEGSAGSAAPTAAAEGPETKSVTTPIESDLAAD
jgi:large subunit ribosomal protein L9